MILCCAECIIEMRSGTPKEQIPQAATILNGTAVCADHMMPLVHEAMRDRRWNKQRR